MAYTPVFMVLVFISLGTCSHRLPVFLHCIGVWHLPMPLQGDWDKQQECYVIIMSRLQPKEIQIQEFANVLPGSLGFIKSKSLTCV